MGGYELSGVSPTRRNVSLMTICVLAGGILIHLALGSFFTFGNMSPYLISYIRNRTDETGTRNIDGIWVISVGSMGNPFGMVAAGVLDRHFGPRITTGVGCLVFSASIAVNYFTVKLSLVAVVTAYGFMSTFGSAMAYGITVQTAIKWLPQRPTLAAGLTVSGFGGGTLIFNNLITAFINPDNLSPDLETDDGERYFTDPELLDRVPFCFVMLGGIYLGMQLIGLIFITNPPEPDVVVSVGISNGGLTNSNNDISTVSETLPEMNISHDTQTANGGNKGESNKDINDDTKDNTGQSLKQVVVAALTSRSFYIVFFTLMCIVSAMLFISSQYKAYGQTFIADDHFLALVGTISSIFNCLGRPFWGMVMDRFGYKVTIRCLSVGLTVATGTIILTERIHKAFFMVWICSAYFFFCGLWAVCPSTLSKLFGAHNTAINYGFIDVALGTANLLSGVFGVTLKDTIGWHGLFFMSCGIHAIPFFLSFLFNGVDTQGKRI